MAKKDNKWATGKPFSVEICDTLRFHVGDRDVAENNRKNAFADREAALDEIAALKDPKSPEYIQAQCNHSGAILRIDSLNNEIKWHNTQIGEIVGNADKPQQLELSLEVPEPKTRKKEDGQLELGEKQTRPVGRPVGRPGPVRPEQPDPSLADGEDQHLAASVQELDVHEDIKGKLMNNGFVTIAHVTGYADGHNGDEEIGRRAKLDDDQVVALLRATQAYRTKHRKAMREVETGETDQPTSGGLKLVGTASGAKPGAGAGGKAAGKGRRKAE